LLGSGGTVRNSASGRNRANDICRCIDGKPIDVIEAILKLAVKIVYEGNGLLMAEPNAEFDGG
jgi:hypothetical protein